MSRIFNYTGNTKVSAAVLRGLVARKSGKNYLRDGTQQDAMNFFVTLLNLIKAELLADNQDNTCVDGFWGLERFVKLYVDFENGSCSKCKLKPRDEIEKFNICTKDIYLELQL